MHLIPSPFPLPLGEREKKQFFIKNSLPVRIEDERRKVKKSSISGNPDLSSMPCF
jgi:hypothetical protein